MADYSTTTPPLKHTCLTFIKLPYPPLSHSPSQDLYDFAAKIRAGTLDWQDIEKTDMDTRLKWCGMLHRAKRTPGRFMMRLRTPNGIVTSELMRFYADSVEPYGPELGAPPLHCTALHCTPRTSLDTM